MPDAAEEAWSRRSVERNWQILDALGDVAEQRGITYSQAALAWLLRRPTVSSALLGVRTPVQLDDNIAAVDINLSDEEYETLDTISRPPADYPYRMIDDFGARPV